MMDLRRTVDLVKGAIFDPDTTWQAWLKEADDWKKTALILTLPLVVASALLAYIVGWLPGGSGHFGLARSGIMATLWQIVAGAAWAFAFALIVSFLAGLFRGNKNYGRALAATTLACVPGYVGQAVFGIAWIGPLIALGLSIYSLVLLWRILPPYLDIPSASRIGHFILTIVSSIVVVGLLTRLVGCESGRTGFADAGDDAGFSAGSVGGGFVGAMARQGQLMEAAENDRYTAPSNGKLSAAQVKEFIRVMQRADELSAKKETRLKEIADRAEDDETPSLSELGEMVSGVTGVLGISSAELEVVKSGGGNWAEHEWVRSTLRTAWIQKDLNDAVRHNYELYQKYEEQLAPFITR